MKLKLNDAGEIETEPRRVVVAPGDTIAWVSDAGDVVVTFDDTPVDGRKFSAAKGKQTDLANVRLDAPRGKHFDCTASIGGKPSKVYGVDIEP